MAENQDKIETQEQWLNVVTDFELIVDEETGKAGFQLYKVPIKCKVIVGEDYDLEDTE